MISKIRKELNDIFEASHNNAGLDDFLESIKNKRIALYGAGYCGQFVLKVLLDNGITPEYFLDLNAREGDNIQEVPIYPPSQILLQPDRIDGVIVLLCVMANSKVQDQIVQNILALGYRTVLLCEDIYFAFSAIFDHQSALLDDQYFSQHQHDIIKCLDLFADTLSLETYKNNISAYILRSFSNTQPGMAGVQYFPVDLSFSRGYSRFVDCGAYDGDTIKDLLSIKGMPEALFAFEPDLGNFGKLGKYVRNKGFKHAALYPCGVSNRTAMQRFNVRGNSQSSISQDGDGVIQCVALDDVLISVCPTFIKMDIEGTEYGALLGAQGIISNYRPDLAISVYHDINHYFMIPLLLDGWDLGYRFWLRTYDRCGTETILYAISER